jgi:hypothetical protein
MKRLSGGMGNRAVEAWECDDVSRNANSVNPIQPRKPVIESGQPFRTGEA